MRARSFWLADLAVELLRRLALLRLEIGTIDSSDTAGFLSFALCSSTSP